MGLLGDNHRVGCGDSNDNQQEQQWDSRETQLPKCCGAPCPGYLVRWQRTGYLVRWWRTGYLVRWQRTEDHSWDEEAKYLMTGLPTGHSLHPFLLLGAHQPRCTALESSRRRPAFTFSSTVKTGAAATFPESSTLPPCLPLQPTRVKGRIPGNTYVP